ncbi:efflux RND transporter periplasmic adaptor subunit [Azonexus sp.]|uniref:efflux RND transporter periplasmic adaptor subunit n=1 Tax=Azonexus sp. TaxID=1872668 RepID=UPI0039E6CC71
MSVLSPFAQCLKVVALLAGVLLAACQPAPENGVAKRAVLVQAALPAAGNGAVLTGEVRARHEVDLAFRVGGKILRRFVDVGQSVRAAEVLAELDPADLQLAASAAAAQRAAAESDLATASAERQRYADLLAKKFVSQAAFDARDNAYNAAQARLTQARSQSQLSANQAAYGVLTSGFPAVVSSVLADAGQVVAAGQPVLRVARPEEKEVLVAVPESRLAEVRAAPEFVVHLWVDPQTALRGQLRELASVADAQTRTYAARIRLIDPPPTVSLGMTARVSLAGAAGSGVLVPLAAVGNSGQGSFVWVEKAGRLQRRSVQVTAFRDDGAVLGEGLAVGEQVAIAGINLLSEGLEIEARLAPEPAAQR